MDIIVVNACIWMYKISVCVSVVGIGYSGLAAQRTAQRLKGEGSMWISWF